ncbi:MAG: tetratricopeptide repeat protein, partial [Streptosporangiaceae bacterium]
PGHCPASPPPARGEPCGKTQLAVFFAESLQQSATTGSLIWVTATSRASILSGYVEAAATLGIDPAGTAESVAARFVSWLSGTARPWLVVLDDLCDTADLDGLWPHGPAGRVLITTAEEDTVPSERRAQVIRVGAFSTREALSFLMGRLTADPDQRHGAIDLTAELGGEPSALVQASGVIASSRLSCHDYRDHFTGRRSQLAGQAAGAQAAAGEVTSIVSAEQAARLSPGGSTQLLLALAALLDGHQIPATVFTTTAACDYLAEATTPEADPEYAWHALLSLEQTGLVDIDPATVPPSIRMNRAVAARVQAAIPEETLDRAVRAAADALQEIWPAEEPQSWLAAGLRSCAASLRHVAGDRLWAAGNCHSLLLRAGESLDSARLTGPAVSHWTQVTATSERILGPSHPATLTAGSHLARALLAAGRAGEAVSWTQWALDGHTSLHGPDHPDTLATRVGLGHATLAAGQPHHAVTILNDAVAEYARVHGADHVATLSVRDELAAAYLAAGEPADAVQHYRRTVADRERTEGPRHPDTMIARGELASAWLADGRFKEAISCYKRTLEDRERALGPDHPDTLATRGNMARAYHAAGKMGAALQLYDQVCAACERILGAGHRDTLAHRADLANAYYAVGRLADATTLFRDTLARCEQFLPPGDPLTQSLRDRMSNIAGG